MKVQEFRDKYPPGDYSGFVEAYLEIAYRFMDVSVQNHRATGDNLEDINEHVIVLQDPETLLNTYETPIVMTWLDAVSPEPATISTDQGTANFRQVVWTKDIDAREGQAHALFRAMIFALSIANNIENDRELINGTGKAVATDTRVTQIAPDTTVPSGSGLKFTALDAEVEYKRRQPR